MIQVRSKPVSASWSVEVLCGVVDVVAVEATGAETTAAAETVTSGVGVAVAAAPVTSGVGVAVAAAPVTSGVGVTVTSVVGVAVPSG